MLNKKRPAPHYYQSLLAEETNEVPSIFREAGDVGPSRRTLSTERYLSQAFHDLEVERMWSRTWQATCRETEIPNAGDIHVYEIAKYSILIVRTPAGSIKAFRNACLHRGRRLRTGSGNAAQLKCPYHGFCWSLDGEFMGAPCAWDFPHVDKECFGLPEVRVGLWGGWVFVNLADDTPSLEDYLGVIPRHFQHWEPENRYKAIHVEKVIGCNWKVASEAFMESHHILATHPQLVTYFSDANSQYDIYGENVSRTITPLGVPSPHIGQAKPEKIVNDWLAQTGRAPRGQKMTVPDDVSARSYLADMFIKQYSAMYQRDLSARATRTEVLDAIFYSIFPNFAPWGGLGPNLVYRFKPYDDRPDKCTMELMMLAPYPRGSLRPKDCRVHRLEEQQSFSEAVELLGLEKIIEQDMGNLSWVQKGLASLKSGEIVLSEYQEVRIAHFHETLGSYVEEAAPQ